MAKKVRKKKDRLTDTQKIWNEVMKEEAKADKQEERMNENDR
jgi:hypothetical protein